MRQKDRPQFYFDLRRFWQSLSPTQSGPSPHPGLLNTMYLLACYWSGDSGLTALEPHFLSRARKYQSDTLQNPATNMLQWLQASTMIAYYLAAATGRFLEARQEVCVVSPSRQRELKQWGACRFQGRFHSSSDVDCTRSHHPIGVTPRSNTRLR